MFPKKHSASLLVVLLSLSPIFLFIKYSLTISSYKDSREYASLKDAIRKKSYINGTDGLSCVNEPLDHGSDYPVGGKEAEQATQKCVPTRHFAFVKTHKCASDTLAAYFMRIIEEQGLEMTTPTGPWNLQWPYPPGTFYKSRKPSGRFDATVLHMMYNRSTWEQIMEPDSKYIGIIRHPFTHFKSYFNYFGIWKMLNTKFGIPVADTFDVFLNDPLYYTPPRTPQTQNLMARDFGFVNGQVDLTEFIESLTKEMDLMMIADYFDESMILLRHELCWPMRDIIYKTKNVAKKYAYSSNKTMVLEDSREVKYNFFAAVDYVMFKTFNETFWKKIGSMPRFHEELADYRQVLSDTAEFCDSEETEITVLAIPQSEFHEKMEIDRQFCSRLSFGVMKYIKLLQMRYDEKSPRYSTFPDEVPL